MGIVSKVIFVIPCYNEARRLDLPAFARFIEGGVDLLFVDDGSEDSTSRDLTLFCKEHPNEAALITEAQNSGKANSVRIGLLSAIKKNYEFVGYADADLATPPAELLRLTTMMGGSASSLQVIMGSRIQRLGSDIQRSSIRHVCGRIFATCASLMLGLNVYDTQCGAKLFRRSDALLRALDQPFVTRWTFDVELIGRLRHYYRLAGYAEKNCFLEVPLDAWKDIDGSKINVWNGFLAVLGLLKVYAHLGRLGKIRT